MEPIAETACETKKKKKSYSPGTKTKTNQPKQQKTNKETNRKY